VWVDMIRIHAETFRRAVAAGVKIAFGTDVGGFDWAIDPAKEFSLMVKYGMTPMQAIRSATTSAAELLDMKTDLGGIAPGKYADIVAVQGDPLNDISLLEKIDFVMKGGEIFKGPTH
jgi:imidazolonepropionase-like amidohydrolase